MSDNNLATLAAELNQPADPVHTEPAPVVDLTPEDLAGLFELADEAPQKQAFSIAEDGRADWALQKIAEERRELERLREIGQEQIASIEEKLAVAERRCQKNTDFLIGHLARYFEQVPHKATKTQETYRLLSGTLVKKYGRVKTITDEAALVKWLKDHDLEDLVRTKEEPMLGELKKRLDLETGIPIMESTGEIVEGITVEKDPDRFDVKV